MVTPGKSRPQTSSSTGAMPRLLKNTRKNDTGCLQTFLARSDDEVNKKARDTSRRLLKLSRI